LAKKNQDIYVLNNFYNSFNETNIKDYIESPPDLEKNGENFSVSFKDLSTILHVVLVNEYKY